MLIGFFSHCALAIFLLAFLSLATAGVVSLGKKSRGKDRPDPPAIFAPIRGMYVCYQCDTIFNTAQCPGCHEDALIPLIHLTGTLMENERVSAVAVRLKEHAVRRFPAPESQLSACLPTPPNGDASKVPMTFLLESQRGGELS